MMESESEKPVNEDLPVKTYTAESALSKPFELFREILTNIQSGRELAWRMFVRNIASLYRQTILGLFWIFLPPMANTAIWVFLASGKNKVVDFGSGITAPYLAYVLAGMVMWQGFIEALNAPLKIVKSNKNMLSRLRFPRESIMVVGLYETLFNFVIRLCILIPILAFFLFTPYFAPEMKSVVWSSWTLLAPLGAVLLIFLGLAIGLLLMPLGMLYHDVGRALLVVTPLWMIFTQIIYPPPEGWVSSPLNYLNPASPLLLATRDLLVLGDTEHWMTAGIYALITLPLFVIGVIVYRVSIPILVERL